MTQKAPTIFVGHGSPMNAIEDTPSSRGWRDAARAFPKPRAIVCVSAHWITKGVRVTASPQPHTIHDIGGFPPELFAVRYPAPGDPELARAVANRLSAFGADLDERWGLDHGTWSVLVHMYPEADIPVLQLSLDARRTPEQHYAIGKALAPLREDGVLLMGSGDIVHNLRAFFQRGAANREAEERQFDNDIIAAVARGDHASVLRYRDHPLAAHAAPDWDHFYPLFYIMAAQDAEERAHNVQSLFRLGHFDDISNLWRRRAMKKDFEIFALAGLAVATAAAAVAVSAGSGAAGRQAAFIAAAMLAAGNVSAALFCAGEQGRGAQITAWIRCGLIAAALSFIVLYAFIVPATLSALTATASAHLTLRSGAIFASSIALGALLVWFSLRLAWRRAAPIANAKP